MKKERSINAGLYLVIDPSMELDELLTRLTAALDAGVTMVQIWDNWYGVVDRAALIRAICELCHAYEVPVFLNNDWELAVHLPLDGVHLDQIPLNFGAIRTALADKYIGLTCGNELEEVKWADKNKLDYISFCSVFPSQTSNSCELVSFDTIRAARQLTELPIFLAGGIRPDRMEQLNDLSYQGIAVISGVMSADSPAVAVKQYLKHLSKHK